MPSIKECKESDAPLTLKLIINNGYDFNNPHNFVLSNEFSFYRVEEGMITSATNHLPTKEKFLARGTDQLNRLWDIFQRVAALEEVSLEQLDAE